MPDEANPPRAYLSRLDAVRGLTIIGVFYYHWLVMTCGFALPAWKGLFRDFADVPFHFWFQLPVHLWVRVPVFYVLSGFVIHFIALKTFHKTGKFDVTDFAVRRFFRIYPVYFLAILVCAFFAWKGKQADVVHQFLAHAFLVHNFSFKTNFGLNPALWTLASEVQFYILYPVLFHFRSKYGLRTVGAALLLAHLIGCLWAAFSQNWTAEISFSYWMSPFVTYIYWAAGAYLAERYFRNQPGLARPIWWIIALIALLLISNFFKPLAWARFHFASALSVYFVDWVVRLRLPLRHWEVPLIKTGLISYSIYLWHTPIIGRIEWYLKGLKQPLVVSGMPEYLWLPLLMSVGGVISFLIIFGISWISFHVLEQPANHFGKRLITRWNVADPLIN